MSANPSYNAQILKGTLALGDCLSIAISGISRAEIDVTSLADANKKYMMGTVDSGTVDLTFNYDSDLNTYLPNSAPNVSEAWSIKFTTTPGATPVFTTITFNAYVQSWSANAAIDQQIQASVTLRVDGAFTFT